jgi:hypothetical protein
LTFKNTTILNKFSSRYRFLQSDAISHNIPGVNIMAFPTQNSDESLIAADTPFIGNFHKTMPHNKFGEVDATAYRKFERTCIQIEAGMPINFEEVPKGQPAGVDQTPFESGADQAIAKFTNPLAGAATEAHGPDPKSLEMLPAPGCRSISAAAEMVELYWMALLRDAPLLAFQQHREPHDACGAGITAHDGASAHKLGYNVNDRVNAALKAVNRMFDCAISHDNDPGRLRAPLDLQAGVGGTDIRLQTLFRTGLFGEDVGPLVSQFFIRPIGYGVQTIDPREVPYIAKRDFLITHGDWLLAQNTGKDKYGRDYGKCNNYADQRNFAANMYYPTENGAPDGMVVKRYISTMRDLARFVNRDALHQAYFNAALFLDGIGATLDEGNPYRGNRYSREGGFGVLGGPDLLTLVSEVASRALKVVWRQKWLVHRRCRPEVYGGLLQMQHNGYMNEKRAYDLPVAVAECSTFDNALNDTLAAVGAHNAAQNGGTQTLFLPMAFSAGSPSHPAYGAGHATVAGACVTVLKAWFDEDEKLKDIFARASMGIPKDPTAGKLTLLQPGYRKNGGTLEEFCDPQEYKGGDADKITVGGELNKLASNVAMGRSMGGVHWRSDNTRSLRLGEAIAIEILRKRTMEYAERPVSFTFRTFDRQVAHITQGQVRIN